MCIIENLGNAYKHKYVRKENRSVIPQIHKNYDFVCLLWEILYVYLFVTSWDYAVCIFFITSHNPHHLNRHFPSLYPFFSPFFSFFFFFPFFLSPSSFPLSSLLLSPLPLLSPSLSFFFYTEDETQSLTRARQTLYQLPCLQP